MTVAIVPIALGQLIAGHELVMAIDIVFHFGESGVHDVPILCPSAPIQLKVCDVVKQARTGT